VASMEVQTLNEDWQQHGAPSQMFVRRTPSDGSVVHEAEWMQQGVLYEMPPLSKPSSAASNAAADERTTPLPVVQQGAQMTQHTLVPLNTPAPTPVVPPPASNASLPLHQQPPAALAASNPPMAAPATTATTSAPSADAAQPPLTTESLPTLNAPASLLTSNVFSSDEVFADLANELECDHSSSLLNELNGLCGFDGSAGAADANCAEDTVDADDLFLSLQEDLGPQPVSELEPPDDNVLLLEELQAMPTDSMSMPLTFGFDAAMTKPKKTKSKASDGGADAPGSKKPKTQKHITLPAMPPAVEQPSVNPNASLPSAKSQCKFLPGAVATPAPPPTKASLGGKPNATTASLGRTFSWQPIKFPVYK